MKKKLSLFLALALCIALLPVNAFAGEASVQWKGAMNFNDANNTVASLGTKTPVDKDYTAETWYAVVDNAYPSTQVIIGDYIYCYNGKMVKYNLDGEKIAESAAFGTPSGWYYEYLTATDDGKYIVVTFSGNQKIYVVKTDDLTVAYEAGSKTNNGTYPAAQYHNGYLFCGGAIYELSGSGALTDVGKRIGTTTVTQTINEEQKDVTFNMTFSWSSGAFVEHGSPAQDWFYVTGYDNNKASKTQNASDNYQKSILYAVDYTTGEVKDSYIASESWNTNNGVTGQVVYDNGWLFWASHSVKKMFAIKLNDDGTFDETSFTATAELNQTSVCAPVITGGRAYLAGNSGYINVIDVDPESPDFMKLIYSTSNTINKIQSNPIAFTGTDGTVYVYVQSYVSSGHLYCLKDTAASTSGSLSLIATPSQLESFDAESFSGSQGGAFAFEQICADADGRIYVVNDAGYMYCFEKTEVKVPKITGDLDTGLVKYNMLDEKDTVNALTVSAESQDEGVLSYQWQKSSDKSVWTDISGAVESSFTPEKTVSHDYYRCEITNTKDGRSASILTQNAEIEIKNFSNDTAVQYILTSANSASGTKQPLSKNANIFLTSAQAKYRIWLDAPENGSITVTQVSGPDKFSEAKNQSGYEYRYFCSAGITGLNKFRIDVTAEDGTAETMFFYMAPDSLKDSAKSATVIATAQKGGAFEFVSAEGFAVASDLAESFGFDDSVNYLEGVSALDVLVSIHKQVYGDAFTAQTADRYLAFSGGYISRMLGEQTGNCGFTINGGYPNDGTESNWGGYNGLSVDQAAVNDNDVLEFFIYQDEWASDNYTYLTAPAEVKAGEAFDVNAEGICYGWMGYLYKTPEDMKAAADEIADVKIGMVNMQTGAVTDLKAVTDDSGKATLTLSDMGTYYLTVFGEDDTETPSIMTLTKIIVNDPRSVKVEYSAQKDGAFIGTARGSITVSSDYAETLGYTDALDSNVSASALDVLAAVHKQVYGDSFTADTKDNYLAVENGGITKLFDISTWNCGFAVNGGCPNDGTESQWGGYNGLAVNQTPVRDNDFLEFFIYQDDSCLDNYTYVTAPSEVTAGTAFDVNVSGVCYAWNSYLYKTGEDMKLTATTIAGISIGTVNIETGAVTDLNVTTGDNGNASVVISEAGTYYLTAFGTDDSDVPVIMTLAKLVVKAKAPTPPRSTDITVYFTLLGDSVHGKPAGKDDTHTLKAGNLQTWIKKTALTLPEDSTVKYGLEKFFRLNGVTCENPTGNYISSVTYESVTLAELDNGSRSGWMYTLNGVAPEVGVADQMLDDGDIVVFYYTDDYEAEAGAEKWNSDKNDNKTAGEGTAAAEETANAAEAGSQVEETVFIDVPADAYFADAVDWAADNGVTAGIGNNKFGTGNDCTREQMVTFLWNLAGKPEYEGESFSDVAEGTYYETAIAWAKSLSIAAGKADGSFGVGDTVTREQVVTFLWNYAGKPEPVSMASFDDVPADAYYAKAVAWAKEQGISSGIGGGKFGVAQTCVREQIVTLMFNFFAE